MTPLLLAQRWKCLSGQILRNREGLCAQSGPHSPLTNRQEEGSTLSVHTQIHETTQTLPPHITPLNHGLTMDVMHRFRKFLQISRESVGEK